MPRNVREMHLAPMEIRTARLRLRQWVAGDRGPFARLNADPRVMEYFPAPLSPEESDALADRIAVHIERHNWGLWAVEIPGVTPFAGFIGLATPRFKAHFTPCIEIGWRLAVDYWAQGFATEGARAVLGFGFGTLGLDEIVSFTVVDFATMFSTELPMRPDIGSRLGPNRRARAFVRNGNSRQ